MKIVICVKQVPDTSDIKWTENNTIQREGLESILNPYDAFAIESALKIKKSVENVETIAITMGPIQANEVIRKSLALGIDYGFVISDKKFAGADTIATSRTLAIAISNRIGKFDLILCGQFAIDGDTAQTPPMIAQNLGLPQVTFVKEILEVNENSVKVKRVVEDGEEIVEAQLPCLLAMIKSDLVLTRPLINGFIRAQKYDVPVYSMEDIGMSSDSVGIKGSPTYVSKAFRPEQKRLGMKIKPDSVNHAVEVILENIND